MSQTPSSPTPSPENKPAHNDFEDRAPHREADDREEIYFHGSPMLRGEVGKVSLYLLIAVILIALPFLIWKFGGTSPHWGVYLGCIVVGLIVFFIPVMITKSVRFRVTNYRIDFERGILGKRIDTLELWHVEDIQFQQTLLDRILGVGTITIISGDDTTPNLRMASIPNPRPLFETLKQRIIAVKRQRGVVKMDIGGHGVGPS